ncbi:MAG: glycoside hydrolase family 3 C-terminal domain-containing protein [Spirochaetales bacterium]|nr:glycoside hydrolase family 3 C-terminal domain-containing protein [Spirochaetales bacterium]
MNKWQRINYQPGTPLGSKGERITASQAHLALSKEAAREGMVLLKNEKALLPLPKGSKIALFGKATIDYVKGGGGSGDVTVSHITNLYDGFTQLDSLLLCEELIDFYKKNVDKQYARRREPGLTVEPELPDPLLDRAAAFCDTALISLCRFSGEGWDRKASNDQAVIVSEAWTDDTARQSQEIFERGDFYLSRAEEALIEKVKSRFDKIIINLNVGGMVDSSWFAGDDRIQSVLLSWQGGMEGGLAAAELFCGAANPSGKLVDSFAKELTDYPSTENFHESPDYVDYTDDIYVGYRFFETLPGASKRLNYPFGFGLSYTDFSFTPLSAELIDDLIKVDVNLTNRGDCEGREVLQLYSQAPQGKLGKPSKELKAFKKSRLLKRGESEIITLEIPLETLASYDDLGRVQKAAYVLEKGEYRFFLGNSSRDGILLDFSYQVKENRIIEQLESRLVPTALKKRLLADGTYEELPTGPGNNPNEHGLEPQNTADWEGMMPQSRFENYHKRGLPGEEEPTLLDVWTGKENLDNFMTRLKEDDLIHLLGGQPNRGVANTFGWGNIPRLGIPNAMTADGPAGVRIEKQCGVTTTAWPCATLLASTWDEEILFAVGEAGAKEMEENNLAIWLTPAVNIHRSPLCGRNFEYYSEDPLVSGKLAAAMVRGIQSRGIAATVKHFAFNNKETNRKESDSRLSERAAREIYLKAFEIIVKEADPWAIMSAYNMVNGHRTSECHELLEDILRGEWGFKGVVTSDWWTRGEHYKELLAGNDIKMACGTVERLKEALEKGLIRRTDLERSARRVLELLLRL